MSAKLEEVLKEIRRLENVVSEELRKSEQALLYRIRNNKVIFEKGVESRHRLARLSLHRFLWKSSFLVILTAPVIYSLILPAILIDVMTSIYQVICFPVYQIPQVKRRDYIVWDRRKLKYLNSIEKWNCLYCSYFNGVIAFVREVASRTEQYWCPIRHALRVRGMHPRYNQFLPYGDEQNYHAKLEELRAKLRQEKIEP